MAVVQLVEEHAEVAVDQPADGAGVERHLSAVPNPDRQPPETFERPPRTEPWYPATDGLLAFALIAHSAGLRVIRVALAEETGAPSSPLTHELEGVMAEALRKGDAGTLGVLLADEAAYLILRSIQLADASTGARATVGRYGVVEIHGPQQAEQTQLLNKLLSIAQMVAERG